MSDICVLGARTIAELQSFHSEFERIFDARQAASFRRDLKFSIATQSNSGTWICMITSARLTVTTPSRAVCLSPPTSNVLSRLLQKQQLAFSMITVRNLESENQAIARVFEHRPNLGILGLVDGQQVVFDEYYANS